MARLPQIDLACQTFGPPLDGDPLANHRLFSCDGHHIYRTISSGLFAAMEGHAAFNERKEGVIRPDADIAARIEFRAALADENIARNRDFAAELLHAKATPCRITTVTR